MTLWDRLWGKARPVADSPLPPEDSRDEEEDQADEGERALAEAVTRLERGEGLEAVMDATLNDALAALVDAGSAHRAANWLDRFVAVAAPDEACARLRLRIATLRIGSGDRRAASPHLRALTEHPEHGARAWFLLGDIAERASDTDEALFAYESCLALDLDYPNVKSRIDALNRRLGEARPKGPDAPTMAGLGRDARRTHAGRRGSAALLASARARPRCHGGRVPGSGRGAGSRGRRQAPASAPSRREAGPGAGAVLSRGTRRRVAAPSETSSPSWTSTSRSA